MSWFSDLADRAETLLNKIDQNAAAVLQEKDKKPLIESFKSVEREHVNQINGESSFVENHTGKISNEQSVEKKIDFKENKPHSLRKSNVLKGAKKNSSPLKRNLNLDNSINNKIQSDSLVLNLPQSSEDLKLPFESSAENNLENPILSDDANKDVEIAIEDTENCIDVEKELLRNEISVVNNELSLLLTKVKSAEKVTDNTQAQLTQVEKSYMQVVKENENLKTIISARENSAQNMNNSVPESRDDIINSLKEERKMLQDRVKELDNNVILSTSIQNKLETELKSSKDMCLELEEKLEKARNETSNILSDWKNYKIRVNNTLSIKEKTIEELGGNQAENVTIKSLNSQINQLKIERNAATQELSDIQNEYSNKLKEIGHLEHKLKSVDKQMAILREALRQEKSAREVAENNVNSLNKEMKTLHSETAKQISALRIKQKEQKFSDLERPKETLHHLSSSFNVAESGDDRVRSLTQALVAKQAALESVTADRNALRLQLEKTENKYRSDLISMRNNQPRIINVNDTDDVKARFPPLLEESPWDSSISRRVKKAYSSLDTFSVRVGVFLRRNPAARIFIISYMIILHIWVSAVLCTYTPEIHSK